MSQVQNAPSPDLDAEVQRRLLAQLADLEDEDSLPPRDHGHVSLKNEWGKANSLKRQAVKLVGCALEDARMGRQVALKPIHHIAQEMLDSLLRNDEALLNLSLIKRHDNYTFQHCVNVGVFLMAIMQSMGYDEGEIIAAGAGGMLHDIGMMRIPLDHYDHPQKLSESQFRQVKKHIDMGHQLLERTPGVTEIALAITGQHHHRMDGSGYTLPWSQDDATESSIADLACILDIYDAMTTKRCYRNAKPPTHALRSILTMANEGKLNPELVHTLIYHIGIYPVGSLIRLENQLMGLVTQVNHENLLLPHVRIIFNCQKRQSLEPFDMNLLEQQNSQGGYAIVAHEHPEKWGIEPAVFLPEFFLGS